MVFQGEGQVEVNGSSSYSNGQTAILCIDVSYSISPVNLGCQGSTGFCYTFNQWVTTGGKVSNDLSSSTSFTPSSWGGDLVLVLNLTGGPWTGYVQGASGITAVAGTFTMPNTISADGSANFETTALWVGIGGFDGNGSLWQAGIEFDCGGCGTGGQMVYASPWWEDYSNSSAGNCNNGPCYQTIMLALEIGDVPWDVISGSLDLPYSQ